MASAAPSRDPSLDAEWEEWKMNFKKSYSPVGNMDEEGHRRAVWEKNKKIVDNHNAYYEQGKTGYSMGLNGFSDMTDEEFRTNCLGRSKSPEDLPKSETLEENSNMTPEMD